MPKAVAPPTKPLSGLFAINKPSGIVSMTILNQLQPLLASSDVFQKEKKVEKWKAKYKGKGSRVKLGQGGTLDPLADGVLGELVGLAFISETGMTLQWADLSMPEDPV